MVLFRKCVCCVEVRKHVTRVENEGLLRVSENFIMNKFLSKKITIGEIIIWFGKINYSKTDEKTYLKKDNWDSKKFETQRDFVMGLHVTFCVIFMWECMCNSPLIGVPLNCEKKNYIYMKN